MHDTAYRIGGLVMDTYLPSCPAKILEIGALNVNGTLRDHSPRNAEYIGLDFEAGEGVNTVITGLDDWNVSDGYFDLVIASSVFEHDRFFWKTFLAMCGKARSGGHVYISAPSNGTIHRYPQDCWRFYPDSGIALEAWGRAEGLDLTLIESFIAEREADGWNDFCAVFQVGPGNGDFNRNFVHNKVRVTNAVNWRSSLIVNSLEDPEDVRLLKRSREEGHVLRLEGEALREELQIMRHAHEEAQGRFSEIEAQLRTRHAAEVTTWESRTADLAKQVEVLSNNLSIAENRIEEERLKARSLADQIQELTDQKTGLEQRLHERFREIAGLTRLIQERDRAMESEHARAEWLRQIASVVTRGFSTSRKARFGSMLPVWFSQRRQKKLLRQHGLFNAEDYVNAYPDVSNSGTDPLRHYINHGIIEGRSTGRGRRGQ